MNDVFFVRIDVPKLCDRLRTADPSRRRMTHGDAFQWLLANGFKMTRRGWLARTNLLLLLEQGELVSRGRIL